VAQSKDAATFLTAALQQVNHELNDHICQSEEDPQTVVIRAVKERISKLTGDLHNIYGDNINEEFRDNWLVFLETGYTSRREPYGILNLKPIDVAPLMRQLLFNSVPSSVFMSATMRIGTSFGYMRREMGMPDTALEFIGESPFDFKNNVVGYFPKDLPDNQDPDYLDALAERIEEVLRFSKGRALVLFTNNKAMQHVHAYCSLRLPYLCLLQGEMSKPMLVDYFQKDTHSCLFATKTYFTGLDIPGESLSCVVLTKAPFEVPTEPMFRAKADRIEESGGDSFNLLAMPRMLFDVRQGFGRLIRTTTDTGIFAFLDSRAMKKSYGSRIVNSLPGIRVMKNLGEEPKPRVAVPTSGASSGYMDEEEDED
jgi:ATP-dependent DNA helicase DinG